MLRQWSPFDSGRDDFGRKVDMDTVRIGKGVEWRVRRRIASCQRRSREAFIAITDRPSMA